jgi:polyisoprenoid-binding protein YceI
MGPVLQAFSGDARGGQVQAKVTKVEFTSATEADVTYTLTLKGATALPDASGSAVEQDGTWKVSAKTLCALVQLSGNASPVPGC